MLILLREPLNEQGWPFAELYLLHNFLFFRPIWERLILKHGSGFNRRFRNLMNWRIYRKVKLAFYLLGLFRAGTPIDSLFPFHGTELLLMLGVNGLAFYVDVLR